MAFPGLCRAGEDWVPMMRAAGADVLIVAAHSGATTSSSTATPCRTRRTRRRWSPEQVPGIDAILVGHAHVEIAERFVTNKETGRPVLLTEPLRWGMRLSVIDIDLRRRGRPAGRSANRLAGAERQHRRARTRQGRRAAAAGSTDKVVRYVNSPIGDVDGGDVGRDRRATRTRRRSTSSTTCSRCRSRRASPARSTPTCRCCPSPRRSTGTPRSPQGTSACATSRGSTSTTTPARRGADRRAGQGVPGVLGEVLHGRHAAGPPIPPTSPTRSRRPRPTAPPTTTTT